MYKCCYELVIKMYNNVHIYISNPTIPLNFNFYFQLIPTLYFIVYSVAGDGEKANSYLLKATHLQVACAVYVIYRKNTPSHLLL